jgi:hypothetical protein
MKKNARGQIIHWLSRSTIIYTFIHILNIPKTKRKKCMLLFGKDSCVYFAYLATTFYIQAQNYALM